MTGSFALHVRYVSVDWLLKVHAPFWSGPFFLTRANIGSCRLHFRIPSVTSGLCFHSGLFWMLRLLIVRDLRRTGFAEGKIGSVGAATLIGFSRSKLSPHAHPARESARSTVNNHFILTPVMQGEHAFCRIMLSKQTIKEMDLRGRLLIC